MAYPCPTAELFDPVPSFTRARLRAWPRRAQKRLGPRRRRSGLCGAADGVRPVLDLGDQCQWTGMVFSFGQWGGVYKERAGRLLGGRTWDELPAAVASAVRGELLQ